MDYEILGSGSDGNAVIINKSIMLDCGLPYKRIHPYIRDLQLVFVGHAHGDHFKASTIRALALERPKLRFCGGPWMISRFVTAGVSKANIDVLECGEKYDYGVFQIEPVTLHHNVPNFGLKIYMNGEKAIYIVDTGSVSGIEAKDFDLILLEANHTRADIEARIAAKKASGEFAYEIEAERNHLSYDQAIEWLASNAGPSSQYVLLHQHRSGKEGRM